MSQLRKPGFSAGEVVNDLNRIFDKAREAEQAGKDPSESLRKLGHVCLNTMQELRNGHTPSSTKPLGYHPGVGDLSDCFSAKIAADSTMAAKPSHRIIWREHDQGPGQPPLREMIALGQRKDEIAYKLAARRLGREPGKELPDYGEEPRPAPDKQDSRAAYNKARSALSNHPANRDRAHFDSPQFN